MWECEWWNKTDASAKSLLRENLPYKNPMIETRLLQEIIARQLFGYVECNSEVPEIRCRYTSNFPTTFKKIVVSKEHIGTLMKELPAKKNFTVKPRKMLIPSFQLTNGTLINPLLLFYLKIGLVCKKIHRFVQYIPKRVSIPSYSLPWMHDVNMKIQTKLLLLRLWSCKVTAHMGIR